jgi:uncharacterized protein
MNAALRVTDAQRNSNPHNLSLRRFAGPSAMVGELDLRIAHLTDIHVGRVTPMRVQEAAVDMAMAENPDLVVITGDFVCHSTKYLDELTSLIARATSRAPVLCVMGNHDYWSGAAEVRWALRRAGAEILDNVNTTMTLRGQQLQVVGLDDAYTGHASRERAVKGMRKDVPTIALSHIAEEADGLWQHGIPLVLSGHTHAGQMTVAKLHEIVIGKLGGHKYIHGLYGCRRAREHKGAVYVGAGIGAAVIPFRVGDRGQREVTIFELGQVPGGLDEHHDDQPALPGRKPSAKKQYKRAAAVVRKEQARISMIQGKKR